MTALPAGWGKINQYTANEDEPKKRRNMEWQLCSIVRLFVSSVLIFRRVDSVMVRKGFVYACYEGIYQFVAVNAIMKISLKRQKVNVVWLLFCLMNDLLFSDLFSFDKGLLPGPTSSGSVLTTWLAFLRHHRKVMLLPFSCHNSLPYLG